MENVWFLAALWVGLSVPGPGGRRAVGIGDLALGGIPDRRCSALSDGRDERRGRQAQKEYLNTHHDPLS